MSAEPIHARIASALRDPVKLIPMLKVIEEDGSRTQLRNARPEQVVMLQDRMTCQQNVILKSRQIGCGVIEQAYDFWYGYTSQDPVSTLVVANKEWSALRHMQRYKGYYDSLPAPLRRPIYHGNTKELWFKDPDGLPGCRFVVTTAGGGDAGRSDTFQRLHLTEYAFWPDAASTFSSLKSICHPGRHRSITIESNSDGPDGDFAEKCDMAERATDWNFRFFPWPMHLNYRKTPPRHFEPTNDELALEWEAPDGLKYHLDNAQILWRRDGLIEHGPTDFRRNFPLTKDEAFVSGGTSYFPEFALEAMRRKAPPIQKVVYREYARYDATKRYAVGMDVGQGLGGDYTVICVVDHNGNQVAVWSDNKTAPWSAGEKAVEIAIRYGKALLLIESNEAGKGDQAIDSAKALGYKNMYVEKGQNYRTTGNIHTVRQGGGSSKNAVFAHARKKLETAMATLYDRLTIQELLNIREDPRTGRLGGADRKHDDHAMAWVLAMWASKRIEKYVFDVNKAIDERFPLLADELLPCTPWARA